MKKIIITVALGALSSVSYAQNWVPAEPQAAYRAGSQTLQPNRAYSHTPLYSEPVNNKMRGGGFLNAVFGGGNQAQQPAAYQQPVAYQQPPARLYAALPTQQNAYKDPVQSFNPKFEPQMVSYSTHHGAGTIVIDTNEKFLYLVMGNGQAKRYGVGVGRPGFEWRGAKTITRKAEWPDWRPPAQMLQRRPDLPRYMAGGENNPLGARALYLGSSLYRIHGTNEPHTIGHSVSSGCFRMRNDDVTDLYTRVRVGTRVVVL